MPDSAIGQNCSRPLYVPGSIEKAWMTSAPVLGRVCKLAAEQIDDVQRWLGYSERVAAANSLQGATSSEAALLSKFVYRDGRVEYIEPLTGFGRHPLSLFMDTTCTNRKCQKHRYRLCPWATTFGHHVNATASLLDIRYLVLHDACAAAGSSAAIGTERGATSLSNCRGHGRNLLFDLGASIGYAERSTSGLSSGTGASLPLLERLYAQRCMRFDEIYAWEAVRRDASDWFRHADADTRRRVHFFNYAIEEGTKAQAVAGTYTGGQSAMAALLHAARPEDYVVLKIDFDPGPEDLVAQALLNRPELAALVDEVLWDYRFVFGAGLNLFGRKKKGLDDVDQALKTMTAFRQRGIRAHFWP